MLKDTFLHIPGLGIKDVVNLETLMVLSCNLKLKDTPSIQSHQLGLPFCPEIPFKGGKETVERIRQERFVY
jgi:hypothetical protein